MIRLDCEEVWILRGFGRRFFILMMGLLKVYDFFIID